MDKLQKGLMNVILLRIIKMNQK